MPGGHAHKLAVDRPADVGAAKMAVRRQLLNHLTDLRRVGRRRQWLAEGDVDGVGNPLRPLPEEPAAVVTEDATPDIVQAGGDDRRGAALDNLFKAAVER